MRWPALMLLVLTVAAHSIALEESPAVQQADAIRREAAEQEVGFLSREAANGYRTLAEEMEINFGGDKSADAVRARAALEEVAVKDVPAVLSKMVWLRTGGEPERDNAALEVLREQHAIESKLRGMLAPGTSSLAVETLRQKAAALLDSLGKAREEARALALSTLGKSETDLSPREKTQLSKLADGQLAAAGDIRSLMRSADDAAGSRPPRDQTGRLIADALDAAQLDKAGKSTDDAAESISGNRLAEAVAREDDAIRRLERFAQVLSGEEENPRTQEALSQLAKKQAELTSETQSAGKDDLPDVTQKQKALGNDTSALAPRLADNALARMHLEDAAAQMESAAAEMAASADTSPEQQTSRAAEHQKNAEEQLRGAQDALRGSELAELTKRLEEESKKLDDAQADLAAMDEIIEQQESLKKRTEQSPQGDDEFKDLMEEQQGLEEKLSALAQQNAGQPQSETKGKGGEKNDSQDSSGGKQESGEKGGGELDRAAEEMKEASKALGRQEPQAASGSQERALAAMRQAKGSAQARAAAVKAGLSKALEAARGAELGGPAPKGLESLLASISGKLAGGSMNTGGPGITGRGRPEEPAAKVTSRGGEGDRTGRPSRDSNAAPAGESPERHSDEAWQARLPETTPPDILQAASGDFPPGYEETLRRYYEELAKRQAPPQLGTQ